MSEADRIAQEMVRQQELEARRQQLLHRKPTRAELRARAQQFLQDVQDEIDAIMRIPESERLPFMVPIRMAGGIRAGWPISSSTTDPGPDSWNPHSRSSVTYLTSDGRIVGWSGEDTGQAQTCGLIKPKSYSGDILDGLRRLRQRLQDTPPSPRP